MIYIYFPSFFNIKFLVCTFAGDVIFPTLLYLYTGIRARLIVIYVFICYSITITRLCNILRFFTTTKMLYFLIFAQNIICGYTLELLHLEPPQ